MDQTAPGETRSTIICRVIQRAETRVYQKQSHIS